MALSGLFGFLLRYDFFHINREQNLPTWFSSIQLFFVAYFAMIVANKESLIEEQEGITNSQVLWYIIAIGFAFLSLDEFAEIHESIRRPGGPTKIWVLVYFPVAFLVACYCGYESRKRRKIYPQLPYVLCGSFLVMGAGAFGGDWAGKYMLPNKFLFGISLIVEEFSEMLGVSILIYALLRYSQELDHKYSPKRNP
jgi:hypothetical protein